MVEAQIYLAQGSLERAITRLTALTAEQPDLHAADTWLLLALARQATGDSQHAMVALATAISIAEPQTNLRAFLNQASQHGPMLVKLLMGIRKEQPDNTFVQQLLALLPSTIENASDQENAHPIMLEPLGDRELEVLQLIVAGHSNKEIAKQLIISPNTVKWYIKTLYGKLHVQSRSQAIARAHERQLVN